MVKFINSLGLGNLALGNPTHLQAVQGADPSVAARSPSSFRQLETSNNHLLERAKGVFAGAQSVLSWGDTQVSGLRAAIGRQIQTYGRVKNALSVLQVCMAVPFPPKSGSQKNFGWQGTVSYRFNPVATVEIKGELPISFSQWRDLISQDPGNLAKYFRDAVKRQDVGCQLADWDSLVSLKSTLSEEKEKNWQLLLPINSLLRIHLRSMQGDILDFLGNPSFAHDVYEAQILERLRTLVELDDEKSFETYVGMLCGSDYKNRLKAVAALGALGDERAIPHLQDRLMDVVPEVCIEAVLSLQKLGAEPVSFLISRMGNPFSVESVSATITLGWLGIEQAQPYVDRLKYLKFRDPSQVEEGLGDYIKVDGLNDRLTRLLAYCGDREKQASRLESSFDDLVSALNHEDESVRNKTVEQLGALGDRRAVPYLAALLKHDSRGEASVDQFNLIAQLSHIGGGEAFKV